MFFNLYILNGKFKANLTVNDDIDNNYSDACSIM